MRHYTHSPFEGHLNSHYVFVVNSRGVELPHLANKNTRHPVKYLGYPYTKQGLLVLSEIYILLMS